MDQKEFIDGIKEHLSFEELCAGLAEEAAELAQAALKLRRSLDMSNPTPVSPADAYGNLTEEVADVLLCLRTMGFDIGKQEVQDVQNRKVKRWLGRLQENKKGGVMV